MMLLGLDGFSQGWVVVALGGGAATLQFISHIDELRQLSCDRVAIDIPIGLPDIDGEEQSRACDLAARGRLKPHQSRVFTGAMRGLWNFASAADANTALKARGQKGVSLQLWHLGPKIMQVDAFVRAKPMLDICEAHPELVFHRLNSERPLPSKKTPEGIALRQQLLAQNGFDAQLLDLWLTKTRIGSGAKTDDVLDACACAIAARDLDRGFCLPPGEPPRDSCGLPMQIRY